MTDDVKPRRRQQIDCACCGGLEWKSYIRQGMCRECRANDFEDYVAAVAGDVPHTIELGRRIAQGQED